MAAESARTRKVRNAVMVVVIVAVAVVAIVLVGNLQGWFGGGGSMSVVSKVGTVNVERSGVSYEIDEGDEVRSGDAIETLSDSNAVIGFDDGGSMAVDEGTQLTVGIGGDWLSDASDAFAEGGYVAEEGMVSAVLEDGLLVVDSPSTSYVVVGDELVRASGAVCTVSYQDGALDVGVLSGDVEVDGAAVDSGNLAVVVSGELTVEELDASIYNDFALGELEELASSGDLCFASDELAQVASDRADQKQQAQEEGIAAAGTGEGDLSCTLEIRCDTILDNMDKLSSSKSSYVPSDGVILPVTTISFSEGDTVYDVLSLACETAGIQIEASWSPLYDNYYIEGIGNIYEYDCGDASGWTYQVNGWTPNYGVSSYELEDGDVVQLLYTCDYGDDL